MSDRGEIMARSVGITTYSNEPGDYHSFQLWWHWDKEGIPFRLSLTERRNSEDSDYQVEIDLIPEGVDDLIIRDENRNVLFSLKDLVDAERDDKLTEVGE